MTQNFFTHEQALAAHWLDTDADIPAGTTIEDAFHKAAKERGFVIPADVLTQALQYLSDPSINYKINQWVVFICFFAHPHTLWNFMIDAVAMAKSDEHLGKIAAGPAEHILAHYGSMIDHFEYRAKQDQKFQRMLTGVWRHRMCDDVWMRLREIQSGVRDPLGNMVPLEHGVEYMADTLSPDDRKNPDKGMYLRDADGQWQKKVDS